MDTMNGSNSNGNGSAGANQRAMKVVYNVTERAGRSYWTRVGVGFENRDGSLNLRLDAFPVNGQLQVREWEADKYASAPSTVDGEGSRDGSRPSVRRRDEALA